MYEGVRIDGVFTKVKIIKKFKRKAAMELQALKTISEIAKPVSSLSKLLLSCDTVDMFILEVKHNRTFVKYFKLVHGALRLKTRRDEKFFFTYF